MLVSNAEQPAQKRKTKKADPPPKKTQKNKKKQINRIYEITSIILIFPVKPENNLLKICQTFNILYLLIILKI